jgi:hypothetical protein
VWTLGEAFALIWLLIHLQANFDRSSRYNRAPMALPFGGVGEPHKVYNKGLKST